MLVAVNYHYVRPRFDESYPSIFGVTPDELAEQLDRLGKIGTFVGADDILAALRGDQALPDRAWVVTFDDGLREQFEHALSVLEDRDIPAVFFANTAPIRDRELSTVHKIHLVRAHVPPEVLAEDLRARDLGDPDDVEAGEATRQYQYDEPEVARLKYFLNIVLDWDRREALVDAWFHDLLGWSEAETAEELYMDRDQLGALAERGFLGTHGHHHVPLATLSSTEQLRQIRTSRELLEDWTDQPIRALSYPYGGRDAVTPRTARAAEDAGIRLAFTMERAGNVDLERARLLARCACNDVPGGDDPRWGPDEVFTEIPEATWYRENVP